MSKMVEFRYYFDISEKNFPQGDWLNKLSPSIFFNYTKPDQKKRDENGNVILNADGTIKTDYGKYIIDLIRFTTIPGVQLTFYMGTEGASYTPSVTIGNSGIYELNLKEMNKNTLVHNKKIKIFGFKIKDTDKEMFNLYKDKFIIVTIVYSLTQKEEEEE